MKSFNRPWPITKDISVYPVKDGIVEVRCASPYFCLSPQLGLYDYPGIQSVTRIGTVVSNPARRL